MKSPNLLGAILVLALLLTACAPAATPPMEPTIAPAEPVATESPAATEPATEPATEAPTGVPVTGEAAINVSEVGTHGSVLVDGSGMSLYIFMHDTQNSGTSACTSADGCTTGWPPLVSQGSPAAGEGVDASLVGTITRDDGSVQVTYNGWPLYNYAGDAAPGDANGQGLNEFGGIWYLVSATGEAVLQ